MMDIFEHLTGIKVCLQPFLKSDISSEYISWLNDPDIVRYSNQRFIRHTKKSCDEFFVNFNNGSNLFLSIKSLNDNQLIGTMTVYVYTHHKLVDIGIMLGQKSLWRQGYAQDAWDTLLDWLIDNQGIRKVIAGTMSCNRAMINIFERSGMRLEATLPRQELLDGEAFDIQFYAKYGPDSESNLR